MNTELIQLESQVKDLESQVEKLLKQMKIVVELVTDQCLFQEDIDELRYELMNF